MNMSKQTSKTGANSHRAAPPSEAQVWSLLSKLKHAIDATEKVIEEANDTELKAHSAESVTLRAELLESVISVNERVIQFLQGIVISPKV